MANDNDSNDQVRKVGAGTFVSAFSASRTPMVVTDPRLPDNPIIWVNDAFLALTGYAREEIEGRNCRMLQGEDTDAGTVSRITEAVAAGSPIDVEILNYRKDGSAFWNGMTIAPVRNEEGAVAYYFAAQADMTEKHRLEAAMADANAELERQVRERTSALEAALEQKTALLHEVDHRVKNNLQVISSLMLLKARRTPLGEARDALEAMAERVGALSTAHRMLYSAGDATQFNIKDFADDFLGDLTATVDRKRTTVSAEFDEVSVSAAMAAPLALLMHEIASNAIRHAFPGDREGRVSIVARREGNILNVRIEDDGIGIGAGTPNPAGFGRSLAEMVVRQLRGTIAWTETNPGTCVAIAVPLDGVRLKGA
ncbi:PAS sensor protein [Methylobacterium sp. Leaf399]|uniref:PAS domain-containing protein n=1 Tax=unclassified Methylobacterium TaxID=2615210 RepID=UPI0006F8712E|nr:MULTISPECIES: PAS domain-containing protein [unclassified Methylobacterium]KQT09818.1 PAS sensor protein [Methylobacterium sp. Leaf399]KQT77946.1 PAS sensor protein [Methylobacterium sp. Leaf466]